MKDTYDDCYKEPKQIIRNKHKKPKNNVQRLGIDKDMLCEQVRRLSKKCITKKPKSKHKTQ